MFNPKLIFAFGKTTIVEFLSITFNESKGEVTKNIVILQKKLTLNKSH